MDDFLKPVAGTQIFLHLAEECGLMPKEGETKKVFMMKSLARLIVSVVTIPFFAIGGILYNCFAAITKGVFYILADISNETGLQKMFLNSFKTHIVYAAEDFIVKISHLLAVGIFVIKPEFLTHLSSYVPLVISKIKT